jgi:excisionase family DNA binding protein
MTLAEEQRLMTVEEAAEYLGVSECTVRRLVHREDLPAVRLGRRMLYSKPALSEYFEDSLKVITSGAAE